MSSKFYYGGQALIEGVMMRGQRHIAVALRQPDGVIMTTIEPLSAVYTSRWRTVPFVRGLIVLVETLVIGLRTLMYSAEVAAGTASEEKKKGLTSVFFWSSMLFGIAVGLGLFLVLPLLVSWSLDPWIGSARLSNLVDGVIRLALFIAYLWAIGFIPEIRRVFAYHGAEHKTVNAYEGGVPLEVDAVRQYSTAHVRCGTAFVLIVLVLAIIVFVFMGQPPLWLRFVERLALFPVIAAVSYELVHLSARHDKNPVLRALLAPGLLLQALTTRQPDDRQLEVAISALKGAVEADAE